MTREDFDRELNTDTVAGLLQAKNNLAGIRALAVGYKRQDIVTIIDGLIQAHDVAILEAEKLGSAAPAEDTLS